MKTNIFKVLCISLTLFIAGCASIPQQASLLSEEIGQRISSIEQSHINLLHNFFDEKRNQIDDFITEKWIPTYANNVFNNPTVSAAWDEIVTSNDTQQRLNFIVKMGTGLQDKINAKRLELIKPLDDLESTLEQKIREEYDALKSANNSLTSYLNSALKVEENRNRYLAMMGITENKMNQTISDIDSFVGKLANTGQTVLDKEKQVKEYLDKINELKEKLIKN